MKIGSHVSVGGGLLGAAKEAASYGANTFMVYTGAPQNTIRKPLSKLKIEEGLKFMDENGISDIVVHAPYIINMASYKDDIYDLAEKFLKSERERAEVFSAKYLVVHPGSYTDKNLEYGIDRISALLNNVLVVNDKTSPLICLETMAGKGSEIGGKLEELAAIIEKVAFKEQLGICLDTCHIHDAGYDIVDDLDGVLAHFDSVLGIDLLKIVHLNGSLNVKGARKDRHANLGAKSGNPKGEDKIGMDALGRVFTHKLLKDKIFILETPWLDSDTNLYKEEIQALRDVANER